MTLHNYKSHGYDLISNEILKKLTNKTIIILPHNSNAMLMLSYFIQYGNSLIIILILKPKKPKYLLTSNRSISLLPTLAK